MSRPRSGLPLVLAFALLSAACAPAGAQDGSCTQAMANLRMQSARYRAIQATLRTQERDVPLSNTVSSETSLRALRSLEATQREAREVRASLLSIYRTLIEQECEPFDEDGYRTTATQFQALDAAGLEQVRKLRRRLDSDAQVQP